MNLPTVSHSPLVEALHPRAVTPLFLGCIYKCLGAKVGPMLGGGGERLGSGQGPWSRWR